jgi:hypothetical protein
MQWINLQTGNTGVMMRVPAITSAQQQQRKEQQRSSTYVEQRCKQTRNSWNNSQHGSQVSTEQPSGSKAMGTNKNLMAVSNTVRTVGAAAGNTAGWRLLLAAQQGTNRNSE